jgi:zeaxanthin epoxidase
MRPLPLALLLVACCLATSTSAFAFTHQHQQSWARVQHSSKAAAAAAATRMSAVAVADKVDGANPLKVIIAGGGVGGLLAARYMQIKGFDVTVYEKTDEFRRFGGPIQLASNALSTINAIDTGLFHKLMEKFTFTGIRTCGIKDGLRTEWYSKFEAITRIANENNLPHTGVVDRPDLQEILIGELGPGVVHNARQVVGFEHTSNGVNVMMKNGEVVHADVLVGADGIWSEVRAQMWGEEARGKGAASYSGYTVFAGETIYEPKDYWDVGYKVYIGPKQYFVTSDIGRGRMQWYAFLALPEGTKARDSNQQFIKERFTGWSPEVHQALDATAEQDIEQRDLYDKKPSVFKSWSQGHVTLLGDSCHCMLPNLGQGGCQAMEDGYVLTNLLTEVSSRSQLPGVLQDYYKQRIVRTAAVQGLSRIASDLIISSFDTPAKITLNPFQVELPGGIRSIMTSLLKNVLPIIFNLQFGYLYSFKPTQLTTEERSDLIATERARARVDAERNWEQAKKDGTYGKGYNREVKQFQAQ